MMMNNDDEDENKLYEKAMKAIKAYLVQEKSIEKMSLNRIIDKTLKNVITIEGNTNLLEDCDAKNNIMICVVNLTMYIEEIKKRIKALQIHI